MGIKDYFYDKIYDKVIRWKLDNLNKVINIQTSNGNWNYDPYMHGLANGLLLAHSIFANVKYEPLDAPLEWLKDKDMPKKVIKQA